MVLMRYIKLKTYQINITPHYNYFYEEGNEQHKCKISHTIMSLVFQLAGF